MTLWTGIVRPFMEGLHGKKKKKKQQQQNTKKKKIKNEKKEQKQTLNSKNPASIK